MPEEAEELPMCLFLKAMRALLKSVRHKLFFTDCFSRVNDDRRFLACELLLPTLIP